MREGDHRFGTTEASVSGEQQPVAGFTFHFHFHHLGDGNQPADGASFQENVMGKLDAIKGKTQELLDAQKVSDDKSDALIALVADLREKLVGAANTGDTTPAEIMEITDMLDRGLKAATEQQGQDESSLNPTPATPPATPTDTGTVVEPPTPSV